MAASGGSWKTTKSGKNRGQKKFTRPKGSKSSGTKSSGAYRIMGYKIG